MNKSYKLTNLMDQTVLEDTLHVKAEVGPCNTKRCGGSIYMPEPSEKFDPAKLRSREQTKVEAQKFLDEYYTSIKRKDTEMYSNRIKKVIEEIDQKGYYEMDEKELIFGTRLAWRNAPRCVGRIQWQKLQVFDCRHVTTAAEMFDNCLRHIKYGTNKGKIRAAISIFPSRQRTGMAGCRIWNKELIQYAGYKKPDGTIIGEPSTVELTEIATQLGWKGKGTNFDVLPLILQIDGENPEVFEIPQEYALEVNINHPSYPEMSQLNLKWFALPAVSNMKLDCGGLEFTAAPFNGWFMGDEIGARNFIDPHRYNLSQALAKAMKLDTSSPVNMWKDRVMVETTFAVLDSFNKAGVTIVDHHTVAESFMRHFKTEHKIRGGCPTDWVWVVPPCSGSSVNLFHQEMLNYKLKPSYDYQVEPWKYFKMKKNEHIEKKQHHHHHLKQVARTVMLSTKMMARAMSRRQKITILYATETGIAYSFATTLNSLFLNGFNSKVMSMEEYDFTDIKTESCILFVVSTTGNGEAPENGQEFARHLYHMLDPKRKDLPISVDDNINGNDELCHLHYAVFALGSKAYPNYCSFGHFVNDLLIKLGAEKIHDIGEGDALKGQEESFMSWAKSCFKDTCENFCIDEINLSQIPDFLSAASTTSTDERYRITTYLGPTHDLCEGLSKLHKKKIHPNRMISIENLQSEQSERITNLARIEICNKAEMEFLPGDHMVVYSSNSPQSVVDLLNRINCGVNYDMPINVEVHQEGKTDDDENWHTIKTLPMPSSLNRIFQSYLDIKSPPSRKLLKIFAEHCTSDIERKDLLKLTENTKKYLQWKEDNDSSIFEVLEDYPSINIKVATLISKIPILKPRLYSISSSLSQYPDEIQLTIGLTRYELKNGRVHNGVCSTWFNALKEGALVPSRIKRAPWFYLPSNNKEPVIMIGPGTGVAPFRSFWQEKMQSSQKQGFEKSPNNIILYFGCRNSKYDDIFAEETKLACQKGGLSKVYTAYSRDQDHSKKYVQDLMKENSKEICDLIFNSNGHLYVCGSAAMGADVLNTITDMVKDNLNYSHEKAVDYVNNMRKIDRYHEDIYVWY